MYMRRAIPFDFGEAGEVAIERDKFAGMFERDCGELGVGDEIA